MPRAAVAIGSLLLLAAGLAAPAAAQFQARLELNGHPLALSRVEQDRLGEVAQVLRSSNRGAQDQALAAAHAAVSSPDARYALATYQLEIGNQRHDDAMRAEAMDVLIATRGVPADRLATWLAARGQIAFRAQDYATASALWTRLAEAQPNDPQVMINLAQVRQAQNDNAGAMALIRRALAARGNASVAPENWYRQWVSIAYNAGMVDETAAAGHALVAAYPTPANWRLALVAWRQAAAPAEAAEIDLLRLMRAAGAFTAPAEYQRHAQLLLHAGFAHEARAVIDEGVARGVLDRTRSPTPDILAEIDRTLARQPTGPIAHGAQPSPLLVADHLFGEGRYAEAAAAYRSALGQSGVDAVAANVRLGMALALAGRSAEAQAAFRTAAESPRSGTPPHWYPDIAAYWLSWLAQPPREQTVTR